MSLNILRVLCIKTSPDYYDNMLIDNCRCIEGYIYEVDEVVDSEIGPMLLITGELHLAECFEEIYD